jgi:SprT protein
MRTSLGLCAPKRRELRIARFVVDGPRDLLLEVLCHEAAHAAVYEIHGRRVRPHGREWRGLMKAAGYEPRARLPAGALDGRFGSVVSRVVWEHRCNVCQAQRQAGRPVREWRCVRCRASGREGSLTITRCELGGGE